MSEALMSEPQPTVLIAEDEEALREALEQMLVANGFRVVAANGTGTEAAESAAALRPDLALVDYRMPGADGVWLTETIKAVSPDTQIILLTAYDEESLSREATHAGAFAFLVKGCPPATIIHALQSAWEFKTKGWSPRWAESETGA